MRPYMLLPVFLLFCIWENIIAKSEEMSFKEDDCLERSFDSYQKKWNKLAKRSSKDNITSDLTNTDTNRSELETLICHLSVKFIERGSYDRSYVSVGTSSLKKLKLIENNIQQLFDLYKGLFISDQEAKKIEKKTPRIFIESFDSKREEDTVRQMLEDLDYDYTLVGMLMKGLLPFMNCTIKGGGAFGGWIIGGGILAHKVQCETPLGQRLIFAKVDLSIGLGIGAMLTKRKRDRGDSPPLVIPSRYLYKKHPKIVFSNANALMIAVNQSFSFVGSTHGVGFGAYLGPGIRTIKKVKTKCPNLKKIAHILELLHKDEALVEEGKWL